MTIQHPVRRRVARDLARIATISSALMLALTAWVAIEGGSTPAGAVTSDTAIVVSAGSGNPVLTGGGSATQLVVKPPNGSKCSGDTATGGYKVTTYMVPAAVSPATLSFNNNGPILPPGSGQTFAQPLYKASGFGKITNLTTGPGDGLITGIPPMTFEIYSVASPTPDSSFPLPVGTYNVGVACTLTTAQPYSIDKLWNVPITFTADAADAPGAFTWTVQGAAATTTTTTTQPGATTTTTTTTAPGTTTTVAGVTTTLPGATTSTAAPRSSTTAPAGVLGESTTPISGTGVVSGVPLPRTGSAAAQMSFWGLLLVMFGRMAILLGRTPKVVLVDP